MLSTKLGRPIQESLLALLVYDDQHGGVVARLLSPEQFDGDYADIARRVGDYWRRYNRPPKRQVDDLFADIYTERTGQDVTYSDLFIHLMEAHQEGINAEFLLDNINRFARFQSLKRLLIDSAEKAQNLGEAAIEDIDNEIDRYRKVKQTLAPPAVTLFEYEDVLAYLTKRSTEFDTGISELDDAFIRPARGAMVLFIGPTGTGKSWALIQMAKRAMLRRKRVLHVTLEMEAAEVAARYYQSLFGVTTRDANSQVTTLLFDDEDEREPRRKWRKFRGFDRSEVTSNFSLADDLAGTELAMHIRQMEGMLGNLRIRRFPGGKLTPSALEAVMDADAASTGFIPDMVVLDYLGIMEVDKNDKRGSLGQTALELRAMAQTRGVSLVTAQQGNREGIKEQKLGKELGVEHVAEDLSLVQTADVTITMSQTSTERELGLMRLFVGKGRNEKDKFGILVTQNYDQGQFAVESHRIPNGYSKAVDDFLAELAGKDGEDDDDDDDQARR
jgi:replicative DNA helicase